MRDSRLSRPALETQCERESTLRHNFFLQKPEAPLEGPGVRPWRRSERESRLRSLAYGTQCAFILGWGARPQCERAKSPALNLSRTMRVSVVKRFIIVLRNGSTTVNCKLSADQIELFQTSSHLRDCMPFDIARQTRSI